VVKPDIEKEAERHELSPGDFAFVPAWTEHQMINETDEEAVWVLTRGGSLPVVMKLSDWGGDPIQQ
jgi:quercetin dioxygenase-like cupin family protein